MQRKAPEAVIRRAGTAVGKQCKDRIAEKPGKCRAFWNAYLMQAVSEINKDMNMKKYARIVEEKIDNILETANPVTDPLALNIGWHELA
ncbi:hypothetical protein [Pseudomonas sp. RIT-PI-q]|uniref:hypothetical protein n=1 Tax=Pseudomonas sp. RIT-PI-q TaxID=1690247 RepID=UPI00128F2D05|nr:hypothetical protein [Pseudomonas sp. RIT-PI-q]